MVAAAPAAAAAAAAAALAAAMAAAAPTPAATAAAQAITDPDIRNPDGTPTDANPGLSIADFGASPIGVPNFMIDQFEIPPFLLPIYQACGTQYGIPWEVLASINKIESAFGTNIGLSTAGAVGWMQFLPSTWKAYGVDANDDGEKDPYNPVDAICAAARYLNAAGGDKDLRTGDLRLQPRRLVRRRGAARGAAVRQAARGLISSITGLTEGAHFPVAADSRYADDISEREALDAPSREPSAATGNAASVIESSPTRARDQHLLRTRRAGRRGQRRRHQGDRRVAAARQVHRPPGRLRQPLHLRAARPRVRRLPGAQGRRS